MKPVVICAMCVALFASFLPLCQPYLSNLIKYSMRVNCFNSAHLHMCMSECRKGLPGGEQDIWSTGATSQLQKVQQFLEEQVMTEMKWQLLIHWRGQLIRSHQNLKWGCIKYSVLEERLISFAKSLASRGRFTNHHYHSSSGWSISHVRRYSTLMFGDFKRTGVCLTQVNLRNISASILNQKLCIYSSVEDA